MQAQVQYLKSIAASGNDNVVVAIPNGCRQLAIKVAANFGAASSSGLSTVITISHDGGSTYVSSKAVVPLLTAAATGEVEVETAYFLRDYPNQGPQDAGPITHIKLTMTNNDGSHAALTAVLTEDQQKIG